MIHQINQPFFSLLWIVFPSIHCWHNHDKIPLVPLSCPLSKELLCFQCRCSQSEHGRRTCHWHCTWNGRVRRVLWCFQEWRQSRASKKRRSVWGKCVSRATYFKYQPNILTPQIVIRDQITTRPLQSMVSLSRPLSDRKWRMLPRRRE